MNDKSADIVEIERLGGLAGFGGPSGQLRSIGQLDLAQLSPAQRKAIEVILDGSSGVANSAPAYPDGFRYRLSRVLPSSTPTRGREVSVEVSESAVPDFVRDAVHDELH